MLQLHPTRRLPDREHDARARRQLSVDATQLPHRTPTEDADTPRAPEVGQGRRGHRRKQLRR